MPKNTRDRILDAGLKLFSKKGYLGATTKEIAAKAGVAELTVFRHFSSKQKLFEEIIRRYSFLPALKGLLPQLKKMDYADALHEIAGKFLERLFERRDLVRIMNSEIYRYPVKVREIYHNFIDEVFRTLAAYFRELQDKGELREFQPELGARAFLGMFFSYFNAREFLLIKEVKDMDADLVIKQYIEIFVEGTKRK